MKDVVIKRFESPEEYHQFLVENKDNQYIRFYDQCHGEYGGLDSWCGGSRHYAMDKLNNGDTTNVAEAEKILDQLKTDGMKSIGRPILEPAVVGYFPNVPAAIIGHPKAMFARSTIDQENISAPIKVYVETTISGGLSHNEIMRRGVAILAFVMVLQTLRPVELYTITGLGGGNYRARLVVTKVASRPIDLGRACFMLTSTAFERRLNYATSYMIAESHDGGHWAWSIHDGKRRAEMMRQALELEPDDVLIYGGHLLDQMCRTRPVQWVNDMLKQHAGELATE